MKVKVAIMNAFVDDGIGGNPAGVVLNADSLSNCQKLNIAKKIGLSETSFVSKSNTADFKLDFFTPEQQIAHCGHATIAAFSYLSQLGLIQNTRSSKETIDGNRDIEINGDFAFMEQLAPKYKDLPNHIDKVLKAVGVSTNDVTTQPMLANTGNSFIIFGVKNIDTLNKIKPDQKRISELSDEFDLIGFYVFTLDTNKEGRDASTRMFAPRYGIQEEAATGMAAGPLACYLHDKMNFDKSNFIIEQGYSMQPPSPSRIEVNLSLKNGSISSLVAGGVGIEDEIKYFEI